METPIIGKFYKSLNKAKKYCPQGKLIIEITDGFLVVSETQIARLGDQN